MSRKVRSIISWDRKGWSDLQIARRLQLRLFTPGFGTAVRISFMLGGMFLWFFTLAYVINDDDGPSFAEIIPFAYILYMIVAIIISADFLQHRNHLPAIWLGSRLRSRAHFARLTLFSYVGVMVKNYAALTLMLLPVYVFLRAGATADFLAVCTSGFLMMMFTLVLSVLSSEIVESPSCKGWTFTTLLILLLLLGIGAGAGLKATHTPVFWISAACVLVVTVILFLYAFKRWTQTEMDFKSPDMGM